MTDVGGTEDKQRSLGITAERQIPETKRISPINIPQVAFSWDILMGMPRTTRQSPGGMILYVLNRGNARDRIFYDDAGYATFAFYASGQSHDLTTGSLDGTEP